MDYRNKGYIRFVVAASITITIFVFLFQRIPFASVFSLIKQVDLKVLAICLMISFIKNIFVAAYRWRLIIKVLGYEISLREILFIKLASDPIVDVLPFKTGEFSKIAYLKVNHNISYSKALFSIVIGYLLNLVVMFICALVGSVFFLKNKIMVNQDLQLVFGLSLFEKAKKRFKSYDFNLIRRVVCNKSILIYTFLFIGIGLVNFYLLSVALGNPLPLVNILVFVPLVIVASNMHVTISGLGIREFVVLFCFSGIGTPEFLLSLGLLYSFIDSLFFVIIGLPFTALFINRTFTDRGK